MGGREGGGEVRVAGRVLLVDRLGRVLLLSGVDPDLPDEGEWWFTPGGGVEQGESVEQAARREAREEVGIELGELGDPVHRARSSFDFAGTHLEQENVFFLVRVDRHEPDASAMTELERRVVTGHRWWSEAELATTDATVYPEGLLEVLRAAGAFDRPASPPGAVGP